MLDVQISQGCKACMAANGQWSEGVHDPLFQEAHTGTSCEW